MATSSIEPETFPPSLWPGLHLVNFKGLMAGVIRQLAEVGG